MTRVAHGQFESLAAEMTPQQMTAEVHQSLVSLAGLQRGNPPDYDDPWIALFYLTWYQPKQIQLVRILIEAQKRAKSLLASNFQRLHVIDFGCGAQAMKFAVTWAADALERREQIYSINIDSYDLNPPMVHIGSHLWQEFKAETREKPQFVSLFRAINIINDRQHTKSDFAISVDQHPMQVWLSAIHVTYRNNKENVGPKLADLSRISNPNIGFLSGHYHTEQSDLLRQVSPFNAPQYKRLSQIITPGFCDTLPLITKWRQSINTRIDWYAFLNGQVTSEFQDALIWIYTKSN